MTTKFRLTLIALPLLVLLIPAGWLLATPAGFLFAVNTASSFAGVSITHDNLQGTLIGEINADHIAYRSETIDVDLDKIQTDISLFWLLDARLALGETKIDKVTLTLKNNSSKTQEYQPPELPVGFSFTSTEIRQLVLIDDKPLLELTDITAERIKINNDIDLQRLAFKFPQGNIHLSGKLGFTETSDIELESKWTISETDKLPEFSGQTKLKGNLKKLSGKTRIQNPQTITVKSYIETPFSNLKWHATINSELIALEHFAKNIASKLQAFSAELHGDNKSVQAKGKTLVTDPSYGRWNSTFDVRLDENSWYVSSLQLMSLDSPASAQLSAKSSGEQAYTSTPNIELVANWKNLQWPLTGKSEYFSVMGNASATGTLDHYGLEATGEFAFGDYNFSRIVLAGSGARNKLDFRSLSVNYLEGTWQGKGGLGWKDGFHWRADLKIHDANPGIQWKNLGGRLSGTVHGEGKHKTDDWIIKGDIKQLSGDFQGYPVSGSSQFNVSGEEYSFKQVRLRSGNNSFKGNIAIENYLSDNATEISARWDMVVNNLAQLIPDAKGTLTSSGKLKGKLSAPDLNASLSAANFSYKTYQFDNVKLQANANLLQNANLALKAEAQNSTINGLKIDRVLFTADGKTHAHKLNIHTTLSSVDSIILNADGGYKNNQWKGKLAGLDVNSNNYGDWKLAKPVAIQASDTLLAIEKVCLNLNAEPETACIDLVSQKYTAYKVSSQIRKLPIALFQHLFPEQVSSIRGTFKGNTSLFLDHQRIKEFTLSLRSDSGELTHSLVNKKPDTIHFENLAINANQDNQDLIVNGGVNLGRTGKADIKLVMSDFAETLQMTNTQPINGHLNIDIADMSLLPVFLPEIQSIQGKTTSRFQISGTLGTPVLLGKSNLTASSIKLPQVGLDLQDTELQAHSGKSKTLLIQGSTRSGDGSLKFKGEIPNYSAEQVLVKLNIDGKQFLAAKTPEIEMEMSPQLVLVLENNTINMDGGIYIDRAQISLLENFTGLAPSSDVVFIDPNSKTAKVDPLKITGSLRLKLSEQVFVQGSGFVGRVTGELVINESSNGVTLATGELTIKDGRYTSPIKGDNIPGLLFSIAQKELLIDEGKLIFASSPVDNPRLDIRARRPTGNEIVVGVDIKGHVNNPQITLFSEPAMDQADILAYLTLGYPLTEASKNDGQYLARIASSIGLVGGEKLASSIAKEFGIDEVYIQSVDTTQQAQLVLGKYLSPRLYVRYAVGIGEAVDALQIQYKLTDRWMIRADTDETQQGSDIIYTIEKD